MINYALLDEKRAVFGAISAVLSYPEKRFINDRFLLLETFENPKTLALITAFWEEISALTLGEITETYVDTFDFNKKTTLYMTFYKFEDARERGQMLAKLKVLYEMFGLLPDDAELTDYLPLMLEFIDAGDWYLDERSGDSIELLIGVIEDGSYHLLQALEEAGNPYRFVIEAMRNELRVCVKQGEEKQHVE
ncbi:nitrate reductase molybdenum cofactor assembly chaperone [Listeria newyorkensis]|uniref:Nitrate reductase molybdenum cofactor assembly chaperone n=1 Tax=Listeria newyorkensis TaxID=1497681 RepID=A0ABX4XMC6_9LIST|nr:nitrate reductase [Listeriaceae bacterium FSL A5-0209]KGL44416.1 nitrate reductase [Listeria newyorkensis]KMT61575.1 respiratory nitrate reductase delta chain [Listeria newyorkensis]PNP92274.1 nitrate reductase molybdenum cofactor assembly chaperone [Listeria newyorkensis]